MTDREGSAGRSCPAPYLFYKVGASRGCLAMRYIRRVYRLPPDREDLLMADLWSAGTAGVESAPEKDGRVRLTAYFPADTPDAGK